MARSGKGNQKTSSIATVVVRREPVASELEHFDADDDLDRLLEEVTGDGFEEPELLVINPVLTAKRIRREV